MKKILTVLILLLSLDIVHSLISNFTISGARELVDKY